MTAPSRRDVLAGAAASLAMAQRAPIASAGEAPGGAPSLKDLGAAKGLLIGTCLGTTNDSDILNLVRRHAAIVSPEWVLKPKFLKPERDGPYRFEDADAIYAFCKQNGLAMHGHTLFWYQEPYKWADHKRFDAVKRDYGAFLEAVIGHYPDLPSWDVANEVVADPGGWHGTKIRTNDYLLKTHGLDMIEFLFKRSRELAPKAELCINDYNLECAQSWCAEKQTQMLSIVDDLLARGTPIDAIGIQSHLSSRDGIDTDWITDFFKRVADRGLKIHLSELDVNDVTFADDPVARDEQVARMYQTYLEAALANTAVTRVVFWGLSDKLHWLRIGDVDDIRPNKAGRPALFDLNYQKKPAFDAVVAALHAAPSR